MEKGCRLYLRIVLFRPVSSLYARAGSERAFVPGRHRFTGRKPNEGICAFPRFAARLCLQHLPAQYKSGRSPADAGGPQSAVKTDEDRRLAHFASDPIDIIRGRSLPGRAKVLLYRAARAAGMHAAVFPDLRGTKAPGPGTGDHCSAVRFRCSRKSRLLYAAQL